MKIKLVFTDWKNRSGQSVYNKPVGIELAKGDFHSGSTFTAEVKFDEDQVDELKSALQSGYTPVFYLVK